MPKFEELGLKPELLKAISDLGFEEPTSIQAKAIPHLLNSTKDLIGFAQTGTGKTAAFSLPVINQISPESRVPQALILCPTRELCLQITRDIASFIKYMRGFSVVPIYGGDSAYKQIDALRRGAQIVVGTPGRVRDLIGRKKLKVDELKFLVLDEADEMLTMGFKEELDAILVETPKEKQTLLFSATMPKEIDVIANKYMHDPEEISADRRNSGAQNVEHLYVMVQARNKYHALKRILDIHTEVYGIIFCRTRAETKDIAGRLMEDGYSTDALHGDLSQSQREYVMGRFRNKNIRILVATDVAARGIDVSDLSHVINFQLPDTPESYVHRSGRTGRAGKSGTSIAIIHSRERYKIKAIERKLGRRFEHRLVPGGEEICKKRLFNFVDIVEEVEINNAQLGPHLPDIYEKLEELSKEDLIQRFVSLEFNRLLTYYRNAPDLNIQQREKPVRGQNHDRGQNQTRGRNENQRGSSTRFSRFYINLGAKQGINTLKLIGLINDNTRSHNVRIGKIEILKNFSFFEIDSQYERQLFEAFEHLKFQGREISIELSKPKPQFSRNSNYNPRHQDQYKKGNSEKRDRKPRRNKKY